MLQDTRHYDVIIIGGGPAGLSAAIYSCRKRLQTLVLTQNIGGQALYSSGIENYLGFTMLSGKQLAEHFREHIERFPGHLHLVEGIEVVSLQRAVKEKSVFEVATPDEKKYKGRCVIIASGRQPIPLGIPGEKKFWGKGVVHSGSADAPLYRGKTVAVIGGGNSAMDAALTLVRFTQLVYMVNNLPELHGDEMMKDKIMAESKIRVFNSSEAKEIVGEEKVASVIITHLDTKQHEELEVEGVFVEVGWQPSVDFDGLTIKDERQRIKVDAHMRTSVPGIFAVGDVNDVDGEHIIIAAGEGAKGALAAADWLNTQ